MKNLNTIALAISLVAATSSAYAGTFKALPDTGASVNGAANSNLDQLFLGSGANLPSTFTLLASNTTSVIPFTNGAGTPITTLGSFIDNVYRDTSDNSLIFASRLQLSPTSGVEINDIFRRGFADFTTANGWEVDAGWFAKTSADFRLKSAAKNDQGFYKIFNSAGQQTGIKPNHYNADVIDLRTDTSAPESNPTSGWYFIKVKEKTAHTDGILSFDFNANAVGLYRGNDEANGPVSTVNFSGYSPVFISNAPVPISSVPEADTYALMIAGISLISVVSRKRKTQL